MTPSECMRVLGLPSSATPEEVKHAYRLLAQRFHPDKHGGREDARQRFMQLAEAYRQLSRAARAAKSGHRVGTCSTCRTFGEVAHSPDGLVRCPRCALGRTRKYLPLPMLIVVRCTIPLILLIVAVCLLISSVERPALSTAFGAFAVALAALFSLAVICLRVVHCLPDRNQKFPRHSR